MKNIIIPILLIAFSINVFAQRGEEMHERIKAQKVGFITERLDLTVEEAQQFWPIYNAFEEKVNNIRKNDLKGIRSAMRDENLSESEAQKILDKYLIVEDKMHNAKKQLVADLGNVLPAKKIIVLKATEDAFNRKLMEKLKERRENMEGMRQQRMENMQNKQQQNGN